MNGLRHWHFHRKYYIHECFRLSTPETVISIFVGTTSLLRVFLPCKYRAIKHSNKGVHWLSFQSAPWTVTRPSRRAASMNPASCSTVLSYPGAIRSIVCIRSRGSAPKLVNIPSMNYEEVRQTRTTEGQQLMHTLQYTFICSARCCSTVITEGVSSTTAIKASEG
jgi:hypothetical protein